MAGDRGCWWGCGRAGGFRAGVGLGRGVLGGGRLGRWCIRARGRRWLGPILPRVSKVALCEGEGTSRCRSCC